MRASRALLLGTVLLVAGALIGVRIIAHRRNSTCPDLERLRESNPVAEAAKAHARGDNHLIGLGGLVGTVPPKGETRGLPVVFLVGTGDTVTEGCSKLRPVAEQYALRYNTAVLTNARR